MLTLPGYQVSEQLYQSQRSRIFRGMRTEDHQPVILKLCADDYPDQNDINRLRHEYQLGRSLDDPHLAHYLALEPYQHAVAIVEEDAGMISLADWLAKGGLELSDFLPVALQLAEAVGVLHDQHIIHKDICPRNIVIRPDTGQVVLIDFSIASQLSRETPAAVAPGLLEGTLTHIAPEQTGRMNRAVDYRADLYGLGVTFYQLLTGQLPFEVSDELELLHCHLSKQPVPPHEVKASIPPVLSELVLKLMAKNPEDRYQSARGVQADLEYCQYELATHGKVMAFELGQRDFPASLQLSQKLYGRDREIETLLTAFDRVVEGGNELLLVAGYSGIGKTSLVQEVHKPIVARRGLFGAGKFDQYQRNTPYFAFIQALESLLKPLLTEPEPKLNLWRDKLNKGLAPNTQVMIELLPTLELIIGPQPPVPNVGAAEAESRFHRTCLRFVSVFARPEHPLVLFLDDLQWADGASLKLLEVLLTDPQCQHLLCLGAYRDNEVTAGHPLLRTLARLREAEANMQTLTLPPLKQADLDLWLADTLHSSPEKVGSLSALVMQKTAGNPFFTNEFLKTLEQQGLLRFDPGQQTWVWEIDRVEQQNITDNVVDLMVAKIRQLPTQTQTALRLGACIGNRFELETLAVICERPVDRLALDLWPAVKAGLLFPLENLNPVTRAGNGSYQLPRNAPVLNTLYKFLHDRVQQAAHEEIPAEQRPEVHLKIGRLLLKNTPADTLDEHLFTLTEQLNAGRKLIVDETERLQLAQLNRRAGEKARASSAYGPAARHFATGLTLLPEQAWQDHYELWFSLLLQRAQAEYLSGRFQKAEQLYERALPHTRTTLDTIKVYQVQMAQYHVQGRYNESLRVQLEGLAQLGWPLPDTEAARHIVLQQELEVIQQQMAARSIESLLDAPLMQDPEKVVMMRLLMDLFYSAYLLGESTLYDLARTKMASLSLSDGHSDYSSLAYAMYGSYLIGTFHDYPQGYRFGTLALQLADQFDSPLIKGRTYYTFAALICPWTRPLDDTLDYFDTAYELGLQTGDWVGLSYVLLQMQTIQLGRGHNLSQLYLDAQNCLSQLKRMKNASLADNLLARVIQPVRQLQGMTQSRFSFDDTQFDEAAYLQKYPVQTGQRASFYLSKLRSAYLFEDRDHWLTWADKAAWVENMLAGLNIGTEVPFYAALIWLQADTAEQTQFRQRIEAIVDKFRLWTEHCPANFMHKYRLLQAEQAWVLKQPQPAMDHYEQAIDAAKAHGFIQMEALASECYGRFWLQQGRDKIARLYLHDARVLYRQWGAQAKVEWLEETYPQLMLQEEAGERFPTWVSGTQSTQRRDLDWLSLMKAAQVIAGKVTLAELLPTLMKLMVENAGAERGALVLGDGHALRIETLYPEPETPPPLPLEDSEWVCEAVIHYTARTRQPLVLNQVAGNALFAQDPYVKRQHPRSILCIPLLEQQMLVGLLYLEHRVLAEAFSPERVELLKVLSAQAAIALKNAHLYDDLSRSEARFRNLIEGSIQGILIHHDIQPLFANQALADMLGFHSPDEVMALDSIEPLLTAKSWEQLRHYRAARARGKTAPQEYELEVLHQSGQIRILQSLDREVIWEGKRAVQSTLVDITERKQAEQQLEYLASYDPLSDLPNRTLFRDRLALALAEAQREDTHVAILLLDLDNFKHVNDSLGQAVGDGLLKAVGQRLLEQVKPTDTVARLGGDEFAVLLPHLQEASAADLLALRLRQTLQDAFHVEAHSINISASIGITLYPDDSEKPETLLRNADLALYKAKSQGRNTYRFYQESMNLQLHQHKNLAEQLRQALQLNRLILHYQPRIDVRSNQVVGVEASPRWPQSSRPISPAQFLPLAEQVGLGVQLGEWMLYRACRQLHDWQQGSLSEFTLCLNLLPSQCQQPDLVERIKAVLDETGIEPTRLELGIKEITLLQDVEIAIDTLSRLAGLGIRFILDDFGAKYSSLGYLRRFPVSGIKLDRSFILELEEPGTRDLLQGMIDLAHRLNLQVIADGVDDEQRLEFLHQAGCDRAQGRYYSRALAPEALEQWLADYALGLR